MKKELKTSIILLIGIFIMILSFNFNIFTTDTLSRQKFYTFQIDSEDLIIGGMIRDKYNINNSKYGLQYIKGIQKNDYNKYNKALSTGKLSEDSLVEMEDYKSQIGVQGRIFSFLYNKLHIPISILHLICSILLAIVITVICYLLKERYGKLFSIVFFIVFLISPWVINFAKNLYWVEFTWFLPLMLCLLLAKTNNKKLYLPLIFLAVLLKCACGYEYLSTILLASISFFIVDFVIIKEKRKDTLKTIFFVGIVSILAFLVAICIHANLRGEGNIIEGIQKIVQEDVMRRTMGNNSESFDNEIIKQSIHASYFETIKKYFNFNTDIIIGVPSNAFMILCSGSLFIIIYNFMKNEENAKRDLIMYITFFIVTISWFILGKAHSYIHTHMNYVLWYFGYIQMVFYTIIKFIIRTIRNINKEELG